MVVDVPKYLYFASTITQEVATLSPEDPVDTECVKAYLQKLQKLQKDGIESSGQHTKLTRIEMTGTFAVKHSKCGRRHW